MHAAHYSSLLPDIFRHQTTKVRVLEPQAILLDFHGTITERRWEDKVISPYVKKALNRYLRNSWQLDSVQSCIAGLRNESFEQRFRHKYEDAPIINDQAESEELDPNELADQMSEFLLWQMTNKRETRETQIIERLVWQDGLRRNEILTPLFADVLPCVKHWRDKYNCSIHIVSSIDEETLKLLLAHTTQGDLDSYVKSYVVARKFGDKMMSGLYRQLYENLLKSLQTKPAQPERGNPVQKQTPAHDTSTKTSSPASSGPSSSEFLPRPILFLTDSGQEAKAASQVSDGQAYECLLINRPGNKRIRSYYLGYFQYVENFHDINFVS